MGNAVPDRNHVLVVFHGRGRGRQDRHAQHIMSRALAGNPHREQIVAHETGSGSLPDLTAATAVVFWLGDPLRELYPDCYAEATAIAARARARGLRVINTPEALSNTRKSAQSALWRAAGIPAAAATPFADRNELASFLAAPTTTFPLIVRTDLFHGQQATFFCATRREAEAAAAHERIAPGVLLEFVDTRAGYERTRPGSLWARYFHKKRAFVFGDEVVPNHVYFSTHPMVGQKVCSFARYLYGNWRWSWLAYLRPDERAALAIDNAFWQGPAEHPEVLRAAMRALDLDFAAIDYSVLADGRPFLWEANPYFDLPDANQGAMPRERHLKTRIDGFDRAIGRFLVSLLAPAAAATPRTAGGTPV